MKTHYSICLLLFISTMSFGQLIFSPASGTQVIPASGGSFKLTITEVIPDATGVSLYQFQNGISANYNSSSTPIITLVANGGPARTLSFKVYKYGVEYIYVVSQLGINCTTLSGGNPTITGSLNPCLNQTVTYSLPTLPVGEWYDVRFSHTQYFHVITTLGGNFDVVFTFTGEFGIELWKRTNCFNSTKVIRWGNVNNNPSEPTISGMNTFTTGSPINFTTTLRNGESNIWSFNSITSTGTTFTNNTTTLGTYNVSLQNVLGNCKSSIKTKSFVIVAEPTVPGVITNIDFKEDDVKVNIFPNPFVESFTIENDEVSSILDMNGNSLNFTKFDEKIMVTTKGILLVRTKKGNIFKMFSIRPR